MTRIKLPYGKSSLDIEIPDERIAGILVSRAHVYKREDSERALVEKALSAPVSSRLWPH